MIIYSEAPEMSPAGFPQDKGSGPNHLVSDAVFCSLLAHMLLADCMMVGFLIAK